MEKVWNVYISSQFTICVHSDGLDFEVKKLTGVYKDYDVIIFYYPGKNNDIVDALSRKAESMGSLAHLQVSRRSLARKVQTLANTSYMDGSN